MPVPYSREEEWARKMPSVTAFSPASYFYFILAADCDSPVIVSFISICMPDHSLFYIHMVLTMWDSWGELMAMQRYCIQIYHSGSVRNSKGLCFAT